MSVSKPAKVPTVEVTEVTGVSLLEKGFLLLLRNSSTLVYPWSKVQAFNFFSLEITLTLQNGKSYTYDFGDNVDHFDQVFHAYVSSFQ